MPSSLLPPPGSSTLSLPYRNHSTSTPPVPPSPPSPMTGLRPSPVLDTAMSGACTVSSLLTPPITPQKPAQREHESESERENAISRVDSIDLDRDSPLTLPSVPKLCTDSVQLGTSVGEGQWARVFYAVAADSRARTYAVKVPRSMKSGESTRVLRHEALVLTFLWECEDRRAQDYIVPFHGLEPVSGALVLGYAPSTLESLVQRYDKGTPLSTHPIVGASEFLALSRSLIAALAWIHARGIIHGDIKPRNILGASVRTMRLADFSSARLASETEPWAGDTCTTAYAAPELLRSFRRSGNGGDKGKGNGGVPTAPSDIWGLAVTLLYAGTGEEPYARIPHALGRLAEATRGTVWEHMGNGANTSRVKRNGTLWRCLNGVLLRSEGTRWDLREWEGFVRDVEVEVEEERMSMEKGNGVGEGE